MKIIEESKKNFSIILNIEIFFNCKKTERGAILYKLSARKNNIFQLTEKEGIEYLEFANAAAGICVEKRGAIPAMASLEEILKRKISE